MNNAEVAKLRDKVTVYRLAILRTQHGNEKRIWSSIGNRWASVAGYSAKMADGRVERVNEVNYRVIMRYCTDIHAGWRFGWRGRMLEAVCEPVAVDGGRQFVYFNCVERVERDGT